jgi:CHASE3 domain sensor protein
MAGHMESNELQEIREDTDGGKRSRVETSDVVFARLLYMPIAIGTMLLGAILGGLGVVLVYLGAKGQTHMALFGANLETADVGVASMFLAVVMVILVLRRLFKSVEAIIEKKPIERNTDSEV